MEKDEMQLEQVKADVYETWAVINRAFEQIITALDKLHNTGVLKWVTSTTKASSQTTCGPRSILTS